MNPKTPPGVSKNRLGSGCQRLTFIGVPNEASVKISDHAITNSWCKVGRKKEEGSADRQPRILYKPPIGQKKFSFSIWIRPDRLIILIVTFMGLRYLYQKLFSKTSSLNHFDNYEEHCFRTLIEKVGKEIEKFWIW